MSVGCAGNFIGCLGFAYLSSMAFAAAPFAGFVKAIAVKKTSMTMLATFVKGIGANWCVNIALFNASTATSSAGKMAALWFPITTFVALGLEHSVANMFMIPLGMMLGADVGMYDFMIRNLAPTIAGNVVGAAGCVGMVHWYTMMPVDKIKEIAGEKEEDTKQIES